MYPSYSLSVMLIPCSRPISSPNRHLQCRSFPCTPSSSLSSPSSSSHFFCVSSPPSPPKSRFDPVLEKDAVMVAATEAGGPSVLPVSVVPPWFSLYKALRMLPKFSFIFIHPKFPCRSVVASTNKFS